MYVFSVWVLERSKKDQTVLISKQGLTYMCAHSVSMDYRMVPSSFPNPVAELECVTLPWRLLHEAWPRGGGLLCGSASLHILRCRSIIKAGGCGLVGVVTYCVHIMMKIAYMYVFSVCVLNRPEKDQIVLRSEMRLTRVNSYCCSSVQNTHEKWFQRPRRVNLILLLRVKVNPIVIVPDM